jgi:hypothetical protein
MCVIRESPAISLLFPAASPASSSSIIHAKASNGCAPEIIPPLMKKAGVPRYAGPIAFVEIFFDLSLMLSAI